MIRLGFYTLAAFCIWPAGGISSEVSGRIIIDKTVAKRTVPAAVYDLRGVAVRENPAEHRGVNGFERVAVWLESSTPSAAKPVNSTMQQHQSHFDPDLLIVPVGSTVAFPNLDPIFHNIFSLSRSQSFDLGYYPQGRSRNVTFPRSGIVQVYCHVHPAMYGVIVVTSSRWAEKPASDGTFSWSDVPAGKYRLVVWQKSTGLVHKSIVVPKTNPIQVTITLPEEDEEN